MSKKQEMRQASVSLPVDLYDRLVAECGSGRVSAYLRGVLETETWRLDRAARRLEGVTLSSDELAELADRTVAEDLGLLEAIQIVVEAEKLGRRIDAGCER